MRQLLLLAAFLLTLSAAAQPSNWSGYPWSFEKNPEPLCDTSALLVINVAAYGIGPLESYDQVNRIFQETALADYNKNWRDRSRCFITEVDKSTPIYTEHKKPRKSGKPTGQYLHVIRWRLFVIPDPGDPPSVDIVYIAK